MGGRLVLVVLLLAASAAAARAAPQPSFKDPIPPLSVHSAQLHAAARQGAAGGALFAVEAGGELNSRSPDDAFTALMAATLRGHTEVVRELIGIGADPHVKDRDGFEAIHGAAFQGRPEAAELLLERTTAVADAGAEDGYTPLHRTTWGRRDGHVGAMRVLLRHGADAGAVHPGSGNTPLHEAARRDNAEAVRVLAGEGGAPLEARNLDGLTPLHLAVRSRAARAAVALAEAGADHAATNADGQTALEAADGDAALAPLLRAAVAARERADL